VGLSYITLARYAALQRAYIYVKEFSLGVSMGRCLEIHNTLINVLRLRGEPVGVKMLERVEDLERLGVKPYPKNLALCQYLKLSAVYGRTIGLTPDNVDACVVGSFILGFREPPPDLEKRWIELFSYSPEIFKKLVENLHRIEMGKYRAAIVAPLKVFDLKNIEPDVVFLAVNSAQAYLLLVGYFDATGYKPSSDFNGHAACEVIAAVINGRSPWLTIPCGGARGIAEAQDDEVWMGFKLDQLEKALNRLKSVGLRYPPSLYEMLTIEPSPEHLLTKLISRT